MNLAPHTTWGARNREQIKLRGFCRILLRHTITALLSTAACIRVSAQKYLDRKGLLRLFYKVRRARKTSATLCIALLVAAVLITWLNRVIPGISWPSMQITARYAR